MESNLNLFDKLYDEFLERNSCYELIDNFFLNIKIVLDGRLCKKGNNRSLIRRYRNNI